MADKQSREVYKPSKKAFYIREKITERELEHCKSLTPQQVDAVIELSKEYEDDDDPLSLKVNIDVSDALTGLKAVQREARNTAKELKEVERLSNKEGTLDGALSDKEKESLFNSMAHNNMGIDQLVNIAEVSGEMQNYGIDVHGLLEKLFRKYKREGMLKID